MRNLLYLIAGILVIGWAVGFFFFPDGGLINILLVIAAIALVFAFVNKRS